MKAVASQVKLFSTEQITEYEQLGRITVRLDDGTQIVLVENEIDIIRTIRRLASGNRSRP